MLTLVGVLAMDAVLVVEVTAYDAMSSCPSGWAGAAFAAQDCYKM